MFQQGIEQVKALYTETLVHWAGHYHSSNPSTAGPIALTFLQNRNDQQAYEWWQRASQEGDPESQFNLALCYLHGKVTTVDTDAARGWFKKSADAGNIDAQRALKALRVYGTGSIHNIPFKTQPKVLLDSDLVARAAAQGEDGTTLLLCGIKQSLEVLEQRKEAPPNTWILESATRNNPDGQFVLGWWYHYVLQDYTNAGIWYSKAVKIAPKAYMHYYLAILYLELGNYRSYAATLSIAANILEYRPAQLHLGRSYLRSKYLVRDIKEGLRLLNAAATHGSAEAMYELGAVYRLGDGAPQDLQQSIEWYKEAAQLGHIRAYYWIAVLKGFHTTGGRRCLEIAANGGSVLAQNDFGTVLAQEKQFEKAKIWLEKALQQGDKTAECNLVRLERYISGYTQRTGIPGMAVGQ